MWRAAASRLLATARTMVRLPYRLYILNKKGIKATGAQQQNRRAPSEYQGTKKSESAAANLKIDNLYGFCACCLLNLNHDASPGCRKIRARISEVERSSTLRFGAARHDAGKQEEKRRTLLVLAAKCRFSSASSFFSLASTFCLAASLRSASATCVHYPISPESAVNHTHYHCSWIASVQHLVFATQIDTNSGGAGFKAAARPPEEVY